MLIQEKIQKRNKKSMKNTIRCTVRITPLLNMKIEENIQTFMKDNIRTNKNEIIRVALYQYLKNSYKEQAKQLQQHRKEHEYMEKHNMNVNEKMLQEITNTIAVLEKKKPLDEEEKQLLDQLHNERKKLFKDLDVMG